MRILINHVFENEEKWLEARKHGIGGSDIGEIIYGSELKVYLSKVEGYEEEPSEAMYFGTVLEHAITTEALKRLENEGHKVGLAGCSFLAQHEQYDWMLASPDATITVDGKECVLECKNVGAHMAREWETGPSPRAYAQVQWYMEVLGLKSAYVAALVGGNSFRLYPVEYDRSAVLKLIGCGRAAWDRIQAKEPPDVGPPDINLIPNLYPTENAGTGVDLTDEALETLIEMQAAKDYADECKARLMRLMGNAEFGWFRDEPIITWKTVTSNRLDTKALKEAHPDIAEGFTKQSSSRRFAPNWKALEDLRNGNYQSNA